MHAEVLPPGGCAVLSTLTQSDALIDFYLARGTALALQLGHRRSNDLDWFTPEPFQPDELLPGLQAMGNVTVSQEAPGTLHAVFQDIRVSFFHYPYPLVKPLIQEDGFRLACILDIGLMKIAAIANRGSKKDFYDLFQIVNRGATLDDLFALLPVKFPHVRYSTYHLLRSLAYFNDAEREPEPFLLQPVAWEEVKEFFRRAQRGMMKQFE